MVYFLIFFTCHILACLSLGMDSKKQQADLYESTSCIQQFPVKQLTTTKGKNS